MTTSITFECRDPEDRSVASSDPAAVREKMLDKTLADSYPASDPPSTLPDPSVDSVGSCKVPGLPARLIRMSDDEINEGECYRHILTHVVVRVNKVRWLEGFTGLVYWEALNGYTIDGGTFGIQEAQHFLEDFYLVRVPATIAS